ncbi:hypothetical protein [Polymorphospora rubra]|nr:hypothetical protein [Polymorphospora rubra]
MTHTRARYRRATVAIGAALILTAAPIATPPAYADSDVAAFMIGSTGGLYKKTGGQTVRVHGQQVSSPGGGLTAIRYTNGNSTAYAIGVHGGLVRSTTTGGDAVGGVTTVGPYGLAPPGAPVSAAGYNVFFVSSFGAVFHKTDQNASQPQQITGSIAPPGAAVAAIPGPIPGVAFVGTDGALRVVRSISTGIWTTSLASPPNFATPGAPIAAVSTAAGYVTGLDGRIWRVGLNGGALPDPWTPTAVAGVGAAPAGAHLSAVQFSGGPAIVMFAGHDGAIWATSNVSGAWHEPTAATAAGVAVAGQPIAATIHGDHIHGDWCGTNWVREIRLPKPRVPVDPDPEPWNAEFSSFGAWNIQPGAHVVSFVR